MVGMLQILTQLLCFYLVLKGVEMVQLSFAARPERAGISMLIGMIALAASIIGAVLFAQMQDAQALAVSDRPSLSPPY
jgi:hypothetical protein